MNPSTKNGLLNTGLVIASVLLMLLVLEVGGRTLIPWILPSHYQRVENHQQLLSRAVHKPPIFKPHPYLSYVPADVRLAENGCRIGDRSFQFQKPPDTIRVACLGGSTTKNAYPHSLDETLEPVFPDKNIEVMDWGCQGWTMVESSLNYVLRARHFKPDVVILHHGINDLAPRVRPNYRYDYSHHRRSFNYAGPGWSEYVGAYSMLGAWLHLRTGQQRMRLDHWTVKPKDHPPVYQYPGKETLRAYKNGINTIYQIAQSDGSQVILAGMVYNKGPSLTKRLAKMVEEHNKTIQTFAKDKRLLYVDTQQVLNHHKDHFQDQAHLSSYGNRIKSKLYASAVGKVRNKTPRVWVEDGLTNQKDVTLPGDQDTPDNRELLIRWNFPTKGIEAIHVYVSVNGGKNQFLGSTQSLQKEYLRWKPEGENITPQFYKGPQFGNNYLFSVWPIPEDKDKVKPAPSYAIKAVTYQKAS